MDWRTKGFWLPDPADVVGQLLFDGAAGWPVMVVKESALVNNISVMQDYCAGNEVLLAPHGKTTMVEQIVRAQLAGGAWAVTFATPHQAMVAHQWGLPRVLVANEVLDPRVLAWAVEQDWEFLSYVDSPEGVAILPPGSRVLVEIGYPGGRGGCRTVAEAVAIADAARARPGVEVVGVSGFEGSLGTPDEVREFLAIMRAASQAIGGEIISAGGSAYFDIVIEELKGVAPQLVLRSGCYVTHDHGLYADTSPLAGKLRAALEVWAQVLSAPEPGLVIASAGRRDLPHDAGMPVPLSQDGTAVEGAFVERLSDQHTHIRGVDARPGDLISLGISHPCTAFDKWRAIPVVDDGNEIVAVYETYF